MTERIPQGHGRGRWAAQGPCEALLLRRCQVWLERGLQGVNALARVQRFLRRQHNMETHGSRCCETCFRHSVLGRRRLACRRCRPARAWGVWGVSPLPQFAMAPRAREAGAPSKPTRRSPPGGKGARGEFRNGKRSASLKGVGRCEERTLPSPTNVPAPRGSGARGPSGGVARKPGGRRRAAPRGKGSPR